MDPKNWWDQEPNQGCLNVLVETILHIHAQIEISTRQ